ncbi:MAG: ABC-type proline/glycine betaine transport system, permease component [Actinobacteria bacterium 66_15]|nr:MAG: ABC-type proline/glycine betaine transport system, permease component [Actinobacteria bacterium 66_15]
MSRARHLAVPAAAAAAYLAVAAATPAWKWVLGAVFPEESRLLYPDATPLALVWQHLELVLISSVLSVVVGLALGIFVTRPAGADFYGVVADLTNLGQTFPPVAVFTLAVPLLGFGLRPTILALALYGVLPVLRNTISGLEGIPADVLESASGLGMRPWQRLARVELPIAVPVIMAGIRVSVIVNVATATIGAIAGAGGFGAPIINGLVNLAPAITLEGAVLAAGLALTLDALLGGVERTIAHRERAAATAR